MLVASRLAPPRSQQHRPDPGGGPGPLSTVWSIEFIQGPLPWRDFSWIDLAFDAVGIALGCLLLTAVRGARGARPWAHG